jgi:hypothetical protein
MKTINPYLKFMLYGAAIMFVLCAAAWIVFAPTPFKSREDAIKLIEKHHQHEADSLINCALEKDKRINQLMIDSEGLYHRLEHTQSITITHIRNETTKKHNDVARLPDDSLDIILGRYLHK